MSNSTTNLDLISSSQAQKEVTANALFDAASPAMLYGRRASATAALTWGYYGGNKSVSGTLSQVANGTLALTANATNYIEVSALGVVSKNTTGFTSGATPLYAVVTGASTITSYTDYRIGGGGGSSFGLDDVHVFTKNQSVSVDTLTDGATIAVDASLSNNFKVTLAGNRTLATPTNLTAGMVLNIELIQDGTGNRTLTFGSAYKFAGRVTPAISTGAGMRDLLSCYYNGSILMCTLNKDFG